MRILMVGDIIGKPGRVCLREHLLGIKAEFHVDFTVVNGENAAAGFGINAQVAEQIRLAGADIVTTGNHVWDRREMAAEIDSLDYVLRPANYPPGTPGRFLTVVDMQGYKIAVISLMGRVFMNTLDDPFRAMDDITASLADVTPNILVDFHAEATSEKQAMAWYLDGRVSAVVGTHTHTQTSDERVLPQGTAMISDIGMVGPRNSILGVEVALILRKFVTQMPVKFEVADPPMIFNAVIIDIDEKTGRAESIKRINREL
ncbi:MAG: TIGR00282 family metallophosphoesterase [bacterium]|jgi:metallophosphoesterase (TIGR00282 family)|nr:TIGR00282 family metallophosphoesterase [bacterium]MDD3805977.1 TIGR00282 family metallophosphoesterase [bacterium]MDD4152653.1 TIGR00282 family metallophosphoesterase [bacterium]MDD4558291.1 TIGR00282 family metallophosphoesterase [bacterium]